MLTTTILICLSTDNSYQYFKNSLEDMRDCFSNCESVPLQFKSQLSASKTCRPMIPFFVGFNCQINIFSPDAEKTIYPSIDLFIDTYCCYKRLCANFFLSSEYRFQLSGFYQLGVQKGNSSRQSWSKLGHMGIYRV